MKNLNPWQQAIVWAVILALGAAVGSGLSSGDWLKALLYAAVPAPFTFLFMWVVIDHRHKR